MPIIFLIVTLTVLGFQWQSIQGLLDKIGKGIGAVAQAAIDAYDEYQAKKP